MGKSSHERWWHQIFDRNAEVKGFVGLTEDEATEKARSEGYKVRVFHTDSPTALTTERVRPRINLLIDGERRVCRAAEF